MNGLADPAQLPLRDIALPAAVSWWPLAPGWWAVTGLVLLLIIGAMIHRHRRRQYLSSAVYQSGLELAGLKRAYRADADDQRLIRSLSALIRRLAISVYPRVDSASLAGEQWLLFLDRVMPDQPFSKGPGRVLARAPYRANSDVDAAALLALTETWIARVGNRNTADDPL